MTQQNNQTPAAASNTGFGSSENDLFAAANATQGFTGSGEDDDIDDEDDDDADTDITEEEKELLDKAGSSEPGEDDDELEGAQLDDTDEDGEKLNESVDLSGADLDVPGSDTDDEDEIIGEEDEENNSYSTSDQEDGEDAIL